MFAQQFEIVLASTSPRRKQILSDAGFKFSIQSKNVDEVYHPALQREQIPLYLAKLKALPLLADIKDELLIAADTIVWLNGKVIGKPVDKENAFEILSQLSGNTHEVITGVYLYKNGVEKSFFDATEVTFRTLTALEIRTYIDVYNPLDKAGSYGIQDWIGLTVVQKINGCYYNVMGLPMPKLYDYLRDKCELFLSL